MENIEELQKIRAKMTRRISIEDASDVLEKIEEQIQIHKQTEKEIIDKELYIVGIKPKDHIVLRVTTGKIIKENIEKTYSRYKKIKEMHDEDIRYILCVEFTEDYKYKIREKPKGFIKNIECKKVRGVTYGVTDGTKVECIHVRDTDIRGVCESDLKEMLKYTFNKRTQQSVAAIKGYLVSYT